MRTSSFFVAGAIFLAAPLARAQNAAPPATSPANRIAPDSPQDGYNTLVAAGKLMVPGENGSPTAPQKYPPAENLRRQRAAVKRNSLALGLLREALQMPIAVPTVTNDEDISASFAPNATFREMARLLIQESDVRLADGDAAGALNSRLTALELGASITRGGTIINSLIGSAIEAIARRDIEIVAAKLNAPQIRAALSRLATIDARRASYADILRQEKEVSTRFALLHSKEFLDTSPEKRFLSLKEFRKEFPMSDAEAREVIALTPQTFAEQYSKAFDALIARGELPYQRALKTKVPSASNVFVRNLIDPFDGIMDSTRFSYERNRTAQTLLEGALELRVIKLESGAYPADYIAPLDPFGDNEPLVYERKGDAVLLYSIGPDGVDNDGRSFSTTRQVFDPETGMMRNSLMRAVQADTKGDILAPVF